MNLSAKFDFESIEKEILTLWDEQEVFSWSKQSVDNPVFSIDTPPPTVSGNLHMGHVFSYCHTDFIARYKRLSENRVFYPIGFDDNGLPTERLVEKVKKIKASDYDRSVFIDSCKEVSFEAKINFRQLFKTLGLSFDWGLEYSTMDERCQGISQKSFIDLYNKGFIYKKVCPVVWDTKDKTAISNAEIEEKKVKSLMNEIIFDIEDGTKIRIATTRPELLPACVAVFFHPDDSRYKYLESQKALIPLFGFSVPILPDKDVQIAKGTGLVMCCTFGDEQDVRWWKRHNLNSKLIILEDGKISCRKLLNDDSLGVAAKIEGLYVTKAREVIIESLFEHNLLVSKTEITHTVRCAERSGSLLEIRLTSQWFISLLPYKEVLLKKVNECVWHPESMKKRIEIWIENLDSDWCISRQRYLGVRFPVWYSTRKGEEGKVLLADIKDLPIDPSVCLPAGYSKEEVQADLDVMDTWATSSLTPFLASDLVPEKLLPMGMRAQSHEIIRTWAFYTIAKAFFQLEIIPWKNIMISGWCLAEDKTKMSKSKGNIIQPDALLSKYGADVVRLWASKASLGADTVMIDESFRSCKKFVNKLWNAAKFVNQFVVVDFNKAFVTDVMDLWILDKFESACTEATLYLEKFDYCTAGNILESFFWNDFCGLYLEVAKRRAYAGDSVSESESLSAKQCLSYLLYNLLIVFSIFVPFVTEGLFSKIFAKDSSMSINNRCSWPKFGNAKIEDSKKLVGDYFVEIVDSVRKIRSTHALSLGLLIPELYIAPKGVKFEISNVISDLKSVCKVSSIFLGEFTKSDFGVESENFIVLVKLSDEK